MSILEPNLKEFGTPIYPLSPDAQTNARLSAILNEAAHVFDWHAEGLWKTEYKDGFARLLMPHHCCPDVERPERNNWLI